MSEKQKQILVTGASRGIGYEIAKNLASRGHKVTAIARTKSKLEKLAQQYPDSIRTHKVDISQASELSAVRSGISGKVDGIVFNAGLLINRPFMELEDADWQRMWDVNVMGVVRLARFMVKHMSKKSHMLIVSSMGGFQGSDKFPGLSAYSATKGAVAILAECLSAELQNQKISVNALCLGAVQTEMLKEAFPDYQAPVSAKDMAEYISDFVLEKHQFYNGKILPVALSNPS